MSVEDKQVIDLIGTEKDGTVVLTITDHLEWSDNNHLLTLQDKLNDYLAFIESGEIFESFSADKNSEIEISVVCKYEPSEEGLEFFTKCKEIINNAGFKFSYETFVDENGI